MNSRDLTSVTLIVRHNQNSIMKNISNKTKMHLALTVILVLCLNIPCTQSQCNNTPSKFQPSRSPIKTTTIATTNNHPNDCIGGNSTSSSNFTDPNNRNANPFPGISTSDPEVASVLGPELTTNDLHSFRLEYNKYKILSHLGILSDLDNISPALDDGFREKLIKSTTISDTASKLATSARRKRSLSCDQVKGNKDACCLENFYVNFTYIGWDKWILYPAGYNANYCKGQCDLSHARYYHSTLLSKYSNVISLCCSPKQMAPLKLLYIDESNKVHEKSIPDMVVESCDCA